MAKKAPPVRKAVPAPKTRASTATAVRNTSVPKSSRKEITQEMIAKRAYEIWKSTGGSEHDNWVRAERELRGS